MTEILAIGLLDAWLLHGTINGTLGWEVIDDPVDPVADSAVRLVESPFDQYQVVIRWERTLWISVGDDQEEHDIGVGLYWAAMGSTTRWEGCPDGGVCHHRCESSACFRVRVAGPLSGVYPGNVWPNGVRAKHGARRG